MATRTSNAQLHLAAVLSNGNICSDATPRAVARGNSWANADLVFTDERGAPVTRLRVKLPVVTKRAGLGGWHLHELATPTTLCDKAEVSARNRADALGHSRVGLAETTYLHRSGVVGYEGIEAMSKLLGETQ